jgi:hypothetical protein
MQKVITVNINARPEDNAVFSEYEIPLLNNALQEGYKVVQVHQSAPSQNLYCTTITFVLEK